MTSEAEFSSVSEIGHEKKKSEQSSILSFMAAAWDFYGGKYVTCACTGTYMYMCMHLLGLRQKFCCKGWREGKVDVATCTCNSLHCVLHVHVDNEGDYLYTVLPHVTLYMYLHVCTLDMY